jgi:hypothetical protein
MEPLFKKRALDESPDALPPKRQATDAPGMKWHYVIPSACDNLKSTSWNRITFVRRGKEEWAPSDDDYIFVDNGATHPDGKPVSVCTQYLQWYFRGGAPDPELVGDMWQRGRDLYFFIRHRSQAVDQMGEDLWRHTAAMYGPLAVGMQGVARGFRDMDYGKGECTRVELDITPYTRSGFHGPRDRKIATQKITEFLSKCPHVGAVRMTLALGLRPKLKSVLWDIIYSAELSGLLSHTDRLYFPAWVDMWDEDEDTDSHLADFMDRFPNLHLYFERGARFRRPYNFDSKHRIHAQASNDEQSMEQWPSIS